ncbi:MAG: flagellar biosynthesis anti-sigma factor FlgM [Bdellovibrionales bacterium RBG_16_40_8]|nr:MAG: flagellar biosynthesis anti-sigma factor FlgM [Bdellovibrionales bacterium RBG_16_40_8]
MKVNNTGAKSVATAQVQAKELEKNLKSGTKNVDDFDKLSTHDSTKIKMSPEAQAFQKAKAIASSDSIDEAKVARLQKLIDEGKYKVDSAAVANRLIDDHLEIGE